MKNGHALLRHETRAKHQFDLWLISKDFFWQEQAQFIKPKHVHTKIKENNKKENTGNSIVNNIVLHLFFLLSAKLFWHGVTISPRKPYITLFMTVKSEM